MIKRNHGLLKQISKVWLVQKGSSCSLLITSSVLILNKISYSASIFLRWDDQADESQEAQELENSRLQTRWRLDAAAPAGLQLKLMMSFCRRGGGDLRGPTLFMMCVCVQVCTLRTSHTSAEMRKSSSSSRRWGSPVSVCLPAWKYVLQLGAIVV